jgi:chromosome segregation ATPase
MKPAFHPILLSLSLCVACSSSPSGIDRAEGTARSMQSLKQALQDAPPKITNVATSLSEITREGGDMKTEFQTFSSHVDSLLTHRETVRTLRANLQANRDEFTNAWEERLSGIKDADLRERAVERRNAVIHKFEELKSSADETRGEFEPWMQSVLDVRTYLESDLNRAGVASVEDRIRAITKEAPSVNESITDIVEELGKIEQAIVAAKPPPAPTTEAK